MNTEQITNSYNWPGYVWETRSAHRMGTSIHDAAGEIYFFRCGFANPETTKAINQHALINEYAIVYIMEGEGRFVDDKGREYPLKPGTVFERLPGKSHHVYLDKGIKKCFCYLAVPADFYHGFKKSRTITSTSPVTYIGLDSKIPDLTNLIINGLSGSPLKISHETQLNIFSLIFLIHTKIEQADDTFSFPDHEAVLVERACNRLNLEIELQIPIPELLDNIPLSYSHIRKLFREQMGMSPGQYRIHRRIEHSKILLADSYYKIKEVAAIMNFPDVHSFSKQFKKVTGKSPSQFQSETTDQAFPDV